MEENEKKKKKKIQFEGDVKSVNSCDGFLYDLLWKASPSVL